MAYCSRRVGWNTSLVRTSLDLTILHININILLVTSVHNEETSQITSQQENAVYRLNASACKVEKE